MQNRTLFVEVGFLEEILKKIIAPSLSEVRSPQHILRLQVLDIIENRRLSLDDYIRVEELAQSDNKDYAEYFTILKKRIEGGIIKLDEDSPFEHFNDVLDINHYSEEQLLGTYFMNDNDGRRIRYAQTLGVLAIPASLNNVDASIFVNLPKKISRRENFHWHEVLNDLLPFSQCNSIIIFDNFIPKSYRSNLVPILSYVLNQDTRCPIDITVVTSDKSRNRSGQINYLTERALLNWLRREGIDINKISNHFKVIQITDRWINERYGTSEDGSNNREKERIQTLFHNRYIITNNYVITCGRGFDEVREGYPLKNDDTFNRVYTMLLPDTNAYKAFCSDITGHLQDVRNVMDYNDDNRLITGYEISDGTY